MGSLVRERWSAREREREGERKRKRERAIFGQMLQSNPFGLWVNNRRVGNGGRAMIHEVCPSMRKGEGEGEVGE